jgi:cephalosporin-C deacetylase-like acetyl esterase
MVGQPSMLAARPPIFADGVPTPLVISLVTSKSLDATRVQDVTYAGDSFSGGIALAVAVVDMTLKDSMEVRRKILGLGREVKRMEMNSKG